MNALSGSKPSGLLRFSTSIAQRCSSTTPKSPYRRPPLLLMISSEEGQVGSGDMRLSMMTRPEGLTGPLTAPPIPASIYPGTHLGVYPGAHLSVCPGTHPRLALRTLHSMYSSTKEYDWQSDYRNKVRGVVRHASCSGRQDCT